MFTLYYTDYTLLCTGKKAVHTVPLLVVDLCAAVSA